MFMVQRTRIGRVTVFQLVCLMCTFEAVASLLWTKPSAVMKRGAASGEVGLNRSDASVSGPAVRALDELEEMPAIHPKTIDVSVQDALGDAGSWGLITINSLLLVLIAIYFAPALHAWSNSTDGSVGQGVQWYPVLLLVVYMGLSTSHTFSAFSVSRSTLHPLLPTICVYVLKLVIAIAMNGRSLFGGADATFVRTAWNHKGVVLAYLFPSACMCFSDVIHFFSLSTLSAAEYQLLIHCRLIMTAPVWQCVLKRKLATAQWGFLGICFWAMLVKERFSFATMALSQASFSHSRLSYIFLQVIVSTFGNVFNEKLLTSSPLSVSEQNVVLYSQSLVMMCGSLAGMHYVQGFDVSTQSLQQLLTLPVIVCILSLSTLGIVVSFLMKVVGVITKEIAGMAVTVITVAIEALYLHKGEWHFLDCQAVILITVSVFAYSKIHVQQTQSNVPAAKPK
eukprot:TRINITY_DN9593_c1_g1_i2.p1 TRINITY_DN9593_c1_g1~~TRINITY_DN9593_c1_g1_i2.p1  ORF type:complete len:451 (+),score=34.93 TRINITY_DN9593_c1_g1_i2:69-1421(+)